jgi:hypothetical protein
MSSAIGGRFERYGQHGNNVRAYRDITSDINEVLIDFEYLAVQKNFLQVQE